jgi:Fe-S oxidoreductase
MLLDYKNLNDNARRDWFKIDEESIKLRHIIVEFMRRLHEYRYAASDFFSDKKKEKSKERLIEAYKGLITNYDPDKFIPDINKLKKEIEASKEVFEFADADIPTSPPIVKRFYERLITGLYKYFSKKGKIEDFIDIRRFIKDYLNQ